MMQYWPLQPSIELNNAVVDLFLNTRNKLKYTLSNRTNNYLYIDLLDNSMKYKLFLCLLKELENLLLEMIELNLNLQQLKKIHPRILNHFIQNNLESFLNSIDIDYINFNIKQLTIKYSINNKNEYIQNDLLIEPLFTYLIFGTSYIDQDLFIFQSNQTPYEHVMILFENFIIKSSDLIVYKIFNQIQYLPNIVLFLKINKLCNNSYISIRSIALFLNKITLQNFLQKYFLYPKTLYNSRYQVWLFSSKGVITKYIYRLQLQELNNISKTKYIYLFFLEILDILIPKIEMFLLTIGQSIMYIVVNLLGNSILLIIRTIINYFKLNK